MASHTSRHTGKNSGFSTQDEHLVLLGLEALTDTSNFRSATRSMYDATSGLPEAAEALNPHHLVVLSPPPQQSPMRQTASPPADEPQSPPPLVEVRDLCVRFVSRE